MYTQYLQLKKIPVPKLFQMYLKAFQQLNQLSKNHFL